MLHHWIILICGLIGNLGFGFSAITLAWATYKTGRAATPKHTSWLFWSACVAFTISLIGQYGFNWLFSVLIVETICWSIVLWYTYWPRGLSFRTALHEGDCVKVGGEVRRVSKVVSNDTFETEPLPDLDMQGHFCCPHRRDWDECPVCCH